jgi:hypothetical protein
MSRPLNHSMDLSYWLVAWSYASAYVYSFAFAPLFLRHIIYNRGQGIVPRSSFVPKTAYIIVPSMRYPGVFNTVTYCKEKFVTTPVDFRFLRLERG